MKKLPLHITAGKMQIIDYPKLPSMISFIHKTISQHFERIPDLGYIADITDSSLKMTYAICCVLQLLFKRKKGIL